jgi:uncharacterized membrane protein
VVGSFSRFFFIKKTEKRTYSKKTRKITQLEKEKIKINYQWLLSLKFYLYFIVFSLNIFLLSHYFMFFPFTVFYLEGVK